MLSPHKLRRLTPEFILMLLVLLGLAFCANRFVVDGKLPQPFIFDINDTFMDWFNTAYWAHNRGAFDVWKTVYPPISFVFLKTFGLPACYASSSVLARDCDWLGITVILTFYFLSAAVAFLAFRRCDRATAPIRGTAFGLGLPLLFTLERGNLIIVCFVFFVLGYSELLRSRPLRALCVAVSINFKPYLLLPAMAWAFRRNWRTFELVAIGSLFVYLVTFALMGSGTVAQLVANMQDWVTGTSGFVWEQVYYSTSYAPFLGFDTYRFPARDVIPSQIVDRAALLIPVVIRTTQLLSVVVLAGAWLQPRALDSKRLAALLFGTYLITQSPGGYAETFLVFLIFMEPWRRPGPIVAITMAYLLCVPYDYVISNIVTLTGNSWLSGRLISAPFGMSVGIIFRPAVMLILVWALLLDSLALIVRAHRRWRPLAGLRGGEVGMQEPKLV